LKEEEEEEDKEVDEIAKWFMLFVCGERLVFESEKVSFSKKKRGDFYT